MNVVAESPQVAEAHTTLGLAVAAAAFVVEGTSKLDEEHNGFVGAVLDIQ